MKILMLCAALLLSSSSAASVLFTAPVGAKRSYEITLSAWIWDGRGSSKGPVPTVQSLSQSKNTMRVTLTCQMLEQVMAQQENGALEVGYTTTCRSSDTQFFTPQGTTLQNFIYQPSGSITAPNFNADIATPQAPRVGSAKKFEHTPWGDLPKLYGAALEEKLEFIDNIHSIIGGDTALLNGKITRTVKPLGQRTSVRISMNHPIGTISSPDSGFQERLLEPLTFNYNILLGSDGRLERGSYQATVNYISGTSRTVGLLQAEIRTIEPVAN
jgi:hypothetical protein